MAERSIAIRRTTYHSLSLVYRQALQAHLHLHLQDFHRRKPQLPRSIPHQQEVGKLLLRNIQDLLSDGKTRYERRFGVPLKGPVIPFGAMVEYHRISAEDLSRLHQFGPKVLPGIFPGYALHAGEFWKGDILVADIEELEQMEASEIYSKRVNAKEVLTPMSGEKFIFPLKLSVGDQGLRTSTLIWDCPDRGEEQGHLQGESDGSCSTPLQDSSLYDGEARNDFWSISGNFIYRHHVEPRVQTVRGARRIISFSNEVHRRNQGYKFIFGCNAGENIDDYWNVDGIRELSDMWTDFTRFTV